MHLQLERWASPVSLLLLAWDEQGILRALEYASHEARMHRIFKAHYGAYTLEDGVAPEAIKSALKAYFDGNLRALSDVQTATGGTDFQREVWTALRAIPAGTTMSYGQIAAQVGRAKASRAVGAANGANPISIVVPCHRVIGSNGTLTGYASGLPNKRWLLEHETRFA